MPSTDIKDYYRRSWGIGDRVGFKNKPLKNFQSAKKKKAIILQGKSSLETRKTIDTWTKNWLDKNLPKYKVRDQKKFINDLRKDYKAFVKKNYSNKSKIGQVNLFSKDGLPNLSRSISEAGTSIFKYEGFKTVDFGQRGSAPLKNPTKWTTYESLLKKIFYKNKIRTDLKLFNNIKEYFNFITTNKRAVEGRELMRNFKPDPDVLYLLDSTKSKLDNAPKGDIFSSFGDEFKTSYDNYRHRMFMGTHWKRNAKMIEDTLGKKEIKRLTGADTIKLAMDREGRALKKIFDFTKLPEDLKLSYAMDHGQGIAAAAKSGNKNTMRLAVTDLIGTTVKANTELGKSYTGHESFESKRSKLVQAIVGGDTTKLKELNEITEKAYGKKNVYKIVNGELISSRISSAKDAHGRYKQYLEKIAKIPVAKKEIIKQSKINPELKKIVKFLNVEDSSKLSSTIRTIMNKQNSGLNVVDIAKWGSAELSALDDIAGKIPSKALGAFGKLLKFAGVVAIPVDAVPFTEAHSTGLTPDVGAMNLAEMYTNLPGMVWEAGEWVASKVQGKEHEWKPFYEFEFGKDYETKKLQETPIEVLEKRVDRFATDMAPQEDFEQVSSYLNKRGINVTDNNVQLQQYEEELLKRMREKKALADQKKKEDNLTGVDQYIINRGI